MSNIFLRPRLCSTNHTQLQIGATTQITNRSILSDIPSKLGSRNMTAMNAARCGLSVLQPQISLGYMHTAGPGQCRRMHACRCRASKGKQNTALPELLDTQPKSLQVCRNIYLQALVQPSENRGDRWLGMSVSLTGSSTNRYRCSCAHFWKNGISGIVAASLPAELNFSNCQDVLLSLNASPNINLWNDKPL